MRSRVGSGSFSPLAPHWRVDSGDASHLLPTSPGTIPGSRQDLPLSRTVLSNQWLPYVDPFACDWPGLRTHPVAGRAPQPQTQANHRMSIRLDRGINRAVFRKTTGRQADAPVC